MPQSPQNAPVIHLLPHRASSEAVEAAIAQGMVDAVVLTEDNRLVEPGQALDEDLAPSLGLPKDSGEIVRTIVPGGPAARAGLQPGDVIVRVNGKQVTPEETVSYITANTPPGTRVPLDIIRAEMDTTMALTGERDIANIGLHNIYSNDLLRRQGY
mgnify:CR=1 FL=1